MAAATSFYAGLSLLPLLIVVISVTGFVLESTQFGADAQQEILRAVEVNGSPLIRQQVERVLQHVSRGATRNGTLGFLGLLFGAMAIFAQFERAFDRIWNVEDQKPVGILGAVRHVVFRRFRAFVMLCGLGALVLTIFIAGVTIHFLEQFASQWWPVPYAVRAGTQWGASVLINAVVFTLLYRLLPKVEVRWKEALWGALLVALGWELGRLALSQVLSHTQYLNAYGTIGAFLAVLIWLYYVCHLIFLGAEFIQVICKRCDVATDDCGS